MIQLLYFARLRETLGCAQENLALPAEITTIGQLRTHLTERGGVWTTLAVGQNVRAARNQDMAHELTPVEDGDEIAFFPPVTGG